MVGQQLGLGVQVDVGPIGHVGAQAFELEEEREFVADEVCGARRPGLGIGAVEGDGAGAVGEVLASLAGGAVVEAVLAVEVVGLPRGHAVLQDIGSLRRVVPDGEGHELLFAAVADKLEEVAAGRPLLGDADRHGG